MSIMWECKRAAWWSAASHLKSTMTGITSSQQWPSCMQDVLFTPQKGRSAPNSLEEARAEQGQASHTATLKAAAAAIVPKRVCALLHTTYIHPAAAQMLVLYSIAECKSPALLKLL